MLRTVVAYGAALLTMGVLDGLWLGVIAKSLYREGMGDLMAEQVNLTAAVAFYLLYPVGLMIFVIRPALAGESAGVTLLRGALLGLFAYMTYDLTSLAVVRGFPARLALIDMGWGAVISALACLAGAKAGGLIGD